jgi:hypothetical protein
MTKDLKSLVVQSGGISSCVQVCDGQIVHYERAGTNYIHGGGKPENVPGIVRTSEDNLGWPGSWIYMFPIISSADQGQVLIGNNGKQVAYKMGGKHGISRHLPWVLKDYDAAKGVLVLVQTHDGVTPIKNTRYDPDKPKNGQEFFEWPFACSLEQRINLSDEELRVGLALTNHSDKPMPYMLGAHPAFRQLGALETGRFRIKGGKDIELRAVHDHSKEHGAFLLPGVFQISYDNTNGGFTLYADFGSMALWSPDENSGMFCVEPVTSGVNPKKDYFVEQPRERKYPSVFPGDTENFEIIVRPRKTA